MLCPVYMQIVFPEAHWIGTKEENPTEAQLPMPAELQIAVQHTKYSFAVDAGSLGRPLVMLTSQTMPCICHTIQR